MNPSLLSYYEALEKASLDMLAAAQVGNWDQVIKLEGACVLLISQLRDAARKHHLTLEEGRQKAAIMQRILASDAEIRQLTEPWIKHLDQMLVDNSKTLQ